MALLSEYAELDDLGNRVYRHTQYIKPIAYRNSGTLSLIDPNWEDSGDAVRPNQVVRAPIMVTVGDDGMRRMHPTRELDRYVEIGAPFVKTGGVWGKVALGIPTRTGQRLQWTRPQANMYVDFGGHFVKLAILFKNGFVPEDSQIAFPVGMQGFTRQGRILLRDNVPVARLEAPSMIDWQNKSNTLDVVGQFVNLDGQPYWLMTLPNYSSMVQPVLDPTVDLQPDDTTGKDCQIVSASPTFNYGAASYNLFGVGERNDAVSTARALLQFDLTSISASATVSSAILTITMSLERSSNARTMRVYRMIRAWTEGTGAGSATGDGATWNTYNGVSNWGTAGAGNTTSDRESTDIGSRAFSATEAVGAKTFTLTNSAVQAWISGAFTNNGFQLKMDTENNDDYNFYTSGDTTATNRPKLSITYTVGTAVPVFFMNYARLRTQ